MRLGIIGLPGAGKKTIFEALTKNVIEPGKRAESRIGTIRVPDERVDVLSKMHEPKRTTYAKVEYFLPELNRKKGNQDANDKIWNQVRDCNALVHVLRNFSGYGIEEPNPNKGFFALDQELIFTDLIVAEKRLERLKLDEKRGRKINKDELALIEKCIKALEDESPLRKSEVLSSDPLLKGFAFLSAKPVLVLTNNNDENDDLPDKGNLTKSETCLVVKGKLEQELSQMSNQEAQEFLSEFNITATARDRVIRASYELLGLISFFTTGEDEVKAWTIKKGTHAVDAADIIHSDIKKGFIRAEVLSFEDLMETGTYQKARKKGTLRLEGKNYEVKDGDIITFRFNV